MNRKDEEEKELDRKDEEEKQLDRKDEGKTVEQEG